MINLELNFFWKMIPIVTIIALTWVTKTKVGRSYPTVGVEPQDNWLNDYANPNDGFEEKAWEVLKDPTKRPGVKNPTKPAKTHFPSSGHFHQEDCETVIDCIRDNFNGMDCIEGKCECITHHDGIMLKYHNKRRQCLLIGGQDCVQNKMCYSGSCYKRLIGKQYEFNIKGTCTADATCFRQHARVLLIVLLIHGVIAYQFGIWNCEDFWDFWWN